MYGFVAWKRVSSCKRGTGPDQTPALLRRRNGVAADHRNPGREALRAADHESNGYRFSSYLRQVWSWRSFTGHIKDMVPKNYSPFLPLSQIRTSLWSMIS